MPRSNTVVCWRLKTSGQRVQPRSEHPSVRWKQSRDYLEFLIGFESRVRFTASSPSKMLFQDYLLTWLSHLCTGQLATRRITIGMLRRQIPYPDVTTHQRQRFWSWKSSRWFVASVLCIMGEKLVWLTGVRSPFAIVRPFSYTPLCRNSVGIIGH